MIFAFGLLTAGSPGIQGVGGTIFGRGLEVTLSSPKGAVTTQPRIKDDRIDFQLQVRNASRDRLLMCNHPRSMGLRAEGARGSVLDDDRYDPRGVMPTDWVVFAPGQTRTFVRSAKVKKGTRGPVEVQGYVWVPTFGEMPASELSAVRRLLKRQKAQLKPGLFETKEIVID